VAYPRRNIWKDFFKDRFLVDVTKIMPHATGTPVLMRVLVDTGKRDGATATLLALAVIVCILLVDFRSVTLTVLAVVPLITAAIWTIGMMTVLKWQFNFVNIMATPLILGIGIDDGVHIVHRYLKEGRGSLTRVLASTGKAVLLTSLTTMLGFGSFVFARYQGYAHLGKLLFLGVGLCFVTSVTVLPALIAVAERTAWGSKLHATRSTSGTGGEEDNA
jgi:predicted RND superfamily exporter protein